MAAGEPTFVSPPPGLSLWSKSVPPFEHASEYPAFVVISDKDSDKGKSPGTEWCHCCEDKSMMISSLSMQLVEANARIGDLQRCLKEAQQKLLVSVAAGSLQHPGSVSARYGCKEDHCVEERPSGGNKLVKEDVFATASQEKPIFEKPMIEEDSRSRDSGGSLLSLPSQALFVSSNPASILPDNLTCNVNVPQLIRCAEKGDVAALTELISSGEDPNMRDDMGITALHGAAKKGHGHLVGVLLGARADANALSHRGEAPLHYAAKYGHMGVVQFLLEGGAQPDAKADSKNKTPLDYAIEKKHVSIKETLQKALTGAVVLSC